METIPSVEFAVETIAWLLLPDGEALVYQAGA